VLVFFVIELQIFVLLYIRLVIHVFVFRGTIEVTNKKNQDQAIQILQSKSILEEKIFIQLLKNSMISPLLKTANRNGGCII